MADLAGKNANLDGITRQFAPELARLCSVAVKGAAAASGTADFLPLVGGDGKVEAAEFTSGEEKLKPMSGALKALQFPGLGTANQPVKVVRRATLACGSKCTLTLIPAADAQPPR